MAKNKNKNKGKKGGQASQGSQSASASQATAVAQSEQSEQIAPPPQATSAPQVTLSNSEETKLFIDLPKKPCVRCKSTRHIGFHCTRTNPLDWGATLAKMSEAKKRAANKYILEEQEKHWSKLISKRKRKMNDVLPW